MGLTHERKAAKPPRHLPQRRSQEQDLRHDLSRQRREAPGQHHLVRQFLRAAAPRRPGAAGLQTRHFHGHADGAGPVAGSGRRRGGGKLTREKPAKAGGAKARADTHASRDKQRAIVLHVARKSGADSSRSEASRLEEAVALTAAIGLEIAEAVIATILRASPATLIGSGKVEELKTLCNAIEPEVVVVNASLSPVQQRNLERAWGAKVLDRTALILEIFGARAKTREGRLQVELAHLTYQRSRLVRSWTHLERQRGGFGFLGGPGETQIETDRRLIGDRIESIRAELEQVRRTRALHRKSRARVPYPSVALVGYTNAGKSTLFNALTGAGVLAEDTLFATLDPTHRAIRLPRGSKAVLSED